MLKVVSFNANGIRSAARKGFFDWFLANDIDVLCVQETKAQTDQLTEKLFNPEGYFHYHVEAQKKGYSGVAIYTRVKPTRVICELGLSWADQEGRYLQLDFELDSILPSSSGSSGSSDSSSQSNPSSPSSPSTLSIVSMYLPSGASGEERQQYKFDFMRFYEKSLQSMDLENRQNPNRNFILCGDWNIVHTEKDIKNFKANQTSSGCLPEERAWLNAVLTNLNFKDAFRVLNQNAEEYSWWSHRGQARAKNVGWRIDYQVVTAFLASKIKSVEIYRDQNFSDHAPVIVEYDLSLG